MFVEIDKSNSNSRSGACTLIKATHNGYQWSAITVYSDSELRQIRDEINKYLGGK